MLTRFGRVFMLIAPIFFTAFLTAEYLWTGSVTNTWIGIAAIATLGVAMFKMAAPRSRSI